MPLVHIPDSSDPPQISVTHLLRDCPGIALYGRRMAARERMEAIARDTVGMLADTYDPTSAAAADAWYRVVLGLPPADGSQLRLSSLFSASAHTTHKVVGREFLDAYWAMLTIASEFLVSVIVDTHNAVGANQFYAKGCRVIEEEDDVVVGEDDAGMGEADMLLAASLANLQEVRDGMELMDGQPLPQDVEQVSGDVCDALAAVEDRLDEWMERENSPGQVQQ